MVITFLLLFEALPGQPNSKDEDMFDEVESMVQMSEPKEIKVPKLEEKVPKKVCYEMPTKRMASHLKRLYVGAHFDGIPVSKVLVDTGATVNILLASIMKKLKKGLDELIPTETTVSGFMVDTTTSKGIIPLQVIVGQKVRVTVFFVVETTVHFNALLEQVWIHISMCVPSSLHQFLQLRHEDGSVEMVRADSQPFMASANVVAERVAKHGSTTHLVEFLQEGQEDDALDIEEVELALTQMDDSKAEVQVPLLEIHLGMKEDHRAIYFSGLMEPELQTKMEELLR
ncbi:hypothetical protein L3X38_018271 [Prunus dulcis]|uniref:Aspartic peptidase DDI1-type domain-containing protein n=1 Tax=Prunus dulcis TaxID=3755 RepID=A0AAD4W8Y2_PRUDU|nr:hypothetical protein L3X38_018271 [Prunus dulcis]